MTRKRDEASGVTPQDHRLHVVLGIRKSVSKVQAIQNITRRRSSRSDGGGAFYQGDRTSTMLQRCTALVPSVHSGAKIVPLAVSLGSCAFDVHEETSVPALTNVTRMGRSTQSPDEYLDGRSVCNCRSDAFQCKPGGWRVFTGLVEPPPYCSDARLRHPVRTAAPRLPLLERHRARICSTSARKTSVSAFANVTRVGRSTQGLNEHLDGRLVYKCNPSSSNPVDEGGLARFTRGIKPQPCCSNARHQYPVRTAVPRLLLLEHATEFICARRPRGSLGVGAYER